MTDFSAKLPKLLLGSELEEALIYLPNINRNEIVNMSANERLLRLTDIFKTFIPNQMSYEIYQKLYIMTHLSLQQKGNVNSTRQLNANYTWIHGGSFQGVITGASSSTIIGVSGIGKTAAIQKAIKLIGPVIEIEKPLHKVIPVLMVTCPFDSNYKGLLCEILQKIDASLNTCYYEHSQKSHLTAQQILGLVCQISHLYIGTLIIDECQFIVEHRAGKQLYMMLMQLINSSQVSILLVGTNECLSFFQQAPQIARRAVGLQYGPMTYGNEFRKLCEALFRHQYTLFETPLTESLNFWLFEHCGGIQANLVSLIHSAQEIAISKGTEKLNIETLNEAYTIRMRMLHGSIMSNITTLPKTSNHNKTRCIFSNLSETETAPLKETIAEIVAKAKKDRADVISRLKESITLEEI